MKPSKCPANNEKLGKEAEKAKGKCQDYCITFKQKTSSKSLLSAHAQTSEVDILNL